MNTRVLQNKAASTRNDHGNDFEVTYFCAFISNLYRREKMEEQTIGFASFCSQFYHI